jgi:hypothetical protein
VITIAVEALASLDERLRVRLLDERLCTFCQMAAPPYRGGKSKRARKQ